MSLAWLFPAGFAALASLLLPLLIHLARRDEQQPIDFAALRWLSPKPHPRRRIRLDQWPLLLLRLLLLALLALLLARPVLHGTGDGTPRVAVVAGVEVSAARTAEANGDAQWLWLAPGFPAIDAPPPAPQQPIASLLRELDASLPRAAPLTVVVPATLQGLDAQRIRLSRSVRWQVVDSTPPPLAAVAPATPRLQIRHDAEGRAALPWLQAIATAWNPDAPADVADDATAFNSAAGVRVWLSAKPVPAAVAQGGPLLVDARTPLPDAARRLPLWRDDDGNLLIERVIGDGRQWLRWAQPLQASSMPVLLDADFPRQLLALLQDPPAPSRAAASEARPEQGAEAPPPPGREPTTWLVIAIALLFLLERCLASSHRGRGAP